MSASILVAYATKYGSTQEVAEAVAAALREGGQTVDCPPAKNVRSLDGYGAVVLGGAAVYVPLAQGRAGLPVAASSGPPGTTGGGLRTGATS